MKLFFFAKILGTPDLCFQSYFEVPVFSLCFKFIWLSVVCFSLKAKGVPFPHCHDGDGLYLRPAL